MVVWSNLETACPFCQHRLRVREVGGGFAAGQDSDLLIRMRGKHVIQAEIHTCQKCRFSGYAEDFASASASPATVKRYFDEIAGNLHGESASSSASSSSSSPSPSSLPLSSTPLPHLQYYWSALAAPVLGLGPTEVGRRLMKAYWCLRLSPSCDLPEAALKRLRTKYLREAIALLRHGLRREKNRIFVYLVGELCRRNSNFGLASQYFERFLYREEGPLYLKQAASRLLARARRGDSSEKTMEELLYERRDRRSADLM